jgi:MYXO-CTERM domain-containing protein
MASKRVALGFAVVLGLLSAGSPARADLPGPREVCETDGLACETCWQHYGASPENDETFNKCKEPLLAKGYKETCRNRQGAGDNVVFCAPGVTAPKVTKGGGCGGCAIGAGDLSNAALAALAGLGALALRRRKAR